MTDIADIQLLRNVKGAKDCTDLAGLKLIRNVWAGREAAIARLAKKKTYRLPPLRTSPPITAVEVISAASTATTDHIGTSVVWTLYCTFTGSWDPVYVNTYSNSLGLPQYGDYASGGTGYIYCSHIASKIRPNSLYVSTDSQNACFEFTATFSPITPERFDLAPLDRPQVVHGGGLELTEIRDRDTTGAVMATSAGERLSDLPQQYVPGVEFQVSWNVADNPLTLAKTYSFSTNSSAIWSQDAYSGVIGKIGVEEVFETYQGVYSPYFRLTVPFRFRSDANSWNWQPFDIGNQFLNSDGNPQQYIDPVSGVFCPIMLDGSGHLLDGTGTGTPVIFPAAVGSTPAGYPTLMPQDWSGLSLPANPYS